MFKIIWNRFIFNQESFDTLNNVGKIIYDQYKPSKFYNNEGRIGLLILKKV